MTSYGAVQSWGPRVEVPGRMLRLTRRGRIARALLLLAAVIVIGGWAVGRLTSQPVLAEQSPASARISTLQVTVQEGDSLWAIAQAAAPLTDPREVVLEIRALNGLSSNMIQPGQVLLVPALP